MNIASLLNESNGALLVVSASDLEEFALNIMAKAEAKAEAKAKMIQKSTTRDQYISTKEACELLGVTRPTLNSWNKKGILSSIKNGYKVHYRMSDVQRFLNEGVQPASMAR